MKASNKTIYISSISKTTRHF